MARLIQSQPASGMRILLVDDHDDYRMATHSRLVREGHEVVTAPGGREALSILGQQQIDLVLLDYFMPGGLTGEQVVDEIRKFNDQVQIILQTGYSGEFPPREMMRRLDIQGYHDKSEGPEKLLLLVDVALKTVKAMRMLNRSRQGLKYILDQTPELYQIRPLEDMLQGILRQIGGLLEVIAAANLNTGKESIPTALPDAFIALLGKEADMKIRAATGKFSNKSFWDSYPYTTKLEVSHEALKNPEITIAPDYIIIPLNIGQTALGVIYLEQAQQLQDYDLLRIFANQVSAAIQNNRL